MKTRKDRFAGWDKAKRRTHIKWRHGLPFPQWCATIGTTEYHPGFIERSLLTMRQRVKSGYARVFGQ